MSGQGKPYWPQEPPTASESEKPVGPEKLRVETKVNVELHQGNKLNHNGDVSQSESSPSQPNSNQLPRRGERQLLQLYSNYYLKTKTRKT